MRELKLSVSNKIWRSLWNMFWVILVRPTPILMHSYRRYCFMLWGAELGQGVKIYPDVKVWWPRNLSMGKNSVLGPLVNVYNVGFIHLDDNALVSQGCHLFTASHDHRKSNFPLLVGDISIGSGAWIAADCFVGPNVKVGNNSVAYARAVLTKSVPENCIVGGNPAKIIKHTPEKTL